MPVPTTSSPPAAESDREDNTDDYDGHVSDGNTTSDDDDDDSPAVPDRRARLRSLVQEYHREEEIHDLLEEQSDLARHHRRTGSKDGESESDESELSASEPGPPRNEFVDDYASDEDEAEPAPCGDPPDSAPELCLPCTPQTRAEGEAYLEALTRFTESIVSESYHRHGRSGPLDFPEEWKSGRPTYYNDSDLDPELQVQAKNLDLDRLTRSFQSHNCNACCFKTGTKYCRFHYPKAIILATGFKDGILYGQRLDTNCNNHNKAMLSVLRSNQDIKWLSTGVDAKATIFYITDYVTKSELSHIQTVTLLKIALDKIDEDKYGKGTPQAAGLNDAENIARQRLFTFLNTMDTDVERSGQWCTLVLLGLPLEYKSHAFRHFNTMSFCRHVQLANATNDDGEDDFEEDATPIINLKDPDAPVTFTNQFGDYHNRIEVKTDRLFPRTDALHLRTPYDETSNNTSQEIEVAQMDPYQYVSRVTKVPLPKPVPDKMPANHVRFPSDHPQHATHVQVVHDDSNPRIPSPIPVMPGFVLPLRTEDPEKYGLTLLSLLTPYDDPSELKDENSTWIDSFDKYMGQIEVLDPHRFSRTTEIITNMTCITSGRGAQLVERIERERLRQEQELIPSVADGPNDYEPGDDDFNSDPTPLDGPAVPSSVYDSLPRRGPLSVMKNSDLSASIDLYSSVHPSVDKLAKSLPKNPRPTQASDVAQISLEKIVLQNQSKQFAKLLMEAKNLTYKAADPGSLPVDRHWIKNIVLENDLDTEQEAAFLTMAMHVLEVRLWELSQSDDLDGVRPTKPSQMIFYMGGEGGTGKSKVLLVFTTFLTHLKLRHTLRIGAPTGVAAGYVNGSTIDSMLNFSNESTMAPVTDTLRKKFATASILFLDEISMLGCAKLQRISTRLSAIKDVKEPFGGMTVILAGDFYQLQPIGGCPLFRAPAVTQAKNFTIAMQGYMTFLKVTHVVFLTNQYRMAKDPSYKDFVNRYRHGEQDPVKDEAYLKKRQITADNPLRTGHLKKSPEDPVIIVDGNKDRYTINIKKAEALANATGQKLLYSVAEDRCSTNKLTATSRYDLLVMGDGGNTQYLAGVLPLVIGMPAMLKHNIGTEMRLANGTIGTIVKIILDPREEVDYSDLTTPHYLRYQPTLHVHFPGSDFQLDGLPPNVLPINNTFGVQSRTASFTYTKSIQGVKVKMNITRKQLWILPAFAITHYTSQGRSVDAAIIDLSKTTADQAEAPYVKLSRLRTGKFLGIQGDWLPTVWETKPDAVMTKYISNKLKTKERKTLANVPSKKAFQQITKAINLLVHGPPKRSRRRQNTP